MEWAIGFSTIVILVSAYIGLKLYWEKRKKALKRAASSAKRSAAQRARHKPAVAGVEGNVVTEPEPSAAPWPYPVGTPVQGSNGTDKSLWGRGEEQ